MTRLSEKERKYLMYQIYSHRYDDPWITNKKVAKLVNRSISTVNRCANQAEEEGIIWSPTLGVHHPERRVALLLFENKWEAFNKLQKYTEIGYICVYQGDWDIMVIYDGYVDFSQVPGYKGTVVTGPREAVLTQKVPYTTWEKCFTTMEDLLHKGSFQKSDLDLNLRYPEWDEEEWALFHYFRPNLRKQFSDLRKEHLISWRTYAKWKKHLREYCTIMVEYFPDGWTTYDNITICFRTEYEQSMVKFLSRLPTTSLFCKIETYLMVSMYIPLEERKQTRLYTIISQLINEKIVTHYMDANSIVYFARGSED